MLKFKYSSFVCGQEELQAILTRKGEEGWRLHTCEPVVTMGPLGSGAMNVFVVMDYAFETDHLEEGTPASDDDIIERCLQEGLAMKG